MPEEHHLIYLPRREHHYYKLCRGDLSIFDYNFLYGHSTVGDTVLFYDVLYPNPTGIVPNPSRRTLLHYLRGQNLDMQSEEDSGSQTLSNPIYSFCPATGMLLPIMRSDR